MYFVDFVVYTPLLRVLAGLQTPWQSFGIPFSILSTVIFIRSSILSHLILFNTFSESNRHLPLFDCRLDAQKILRIARKIFPVNSQDFTFKPKSWSNSYVLRERARINLSRRQRHREKTHSGEKKQIWVDDIYKTRGYNLDLLLAPVLHRLCLRLYLNL